MKRFLSFYHKTPDWAKLAILSQVFITCIGFIQFATNDRPIRNFPIMMFIAFTVPMIPFFALRISQSLIKNKTWSFLTKQVIEAVSLILSVIPLVYWSKLTNFWIKKWEGFKFVVSPHEDIQYTQEDIQRMEMHYYHLDLSWEHLFPLFLTFGLILTGIALVRVGYKVKHHIESTEQAEQLAQLKAQNTRSHLRALQARINPHFLYNALNNIAGLTHEAPDKAEQMSVSLAALFREALNREEQDLATVAQEIEIVQHYLTIEKIRFGDALQYEIEVTPNAKNWQVPRFLLQPLVENAVKHGIEPNGSGKVVVRILAEQNALHIAVEDSGKPFPATLSGGFGLQNVQDSLELLFPNRYSLELKNATQNTAKQVVLRLTN